MKGFILAAIHAAEKCTLILDWRKILTKSLEREL